MSKHYTSSSENKKRYYAEGPSRIPKNKIKRITAHLKRQPNDLQSKKAIEI